VEGRNEALIRELREAIEASRSVQPLTAVKLLTEALVEMADDFDYETDAVYEGKPLVVAGQALSRVTREALVSDPDETRRALERLNNSTIQNLVNTGLGGGEGMKATIILLRNDIPAPTAPPTTTPTSIAAVTDRRAKETAEKTARETFRTSAKRSLTEIAAAMRVINGRTLAEFTRTERSLFWATTILTTDLSESDGDVRCAKAQLQLLNEDEWRDLNFNEFWMSHWSPAAQAKRLREAIELIKRPNDFRNPVHNESWEGRIAEVDIMLSEVTNLQEARKQLTHDEQAVLISVESIVIKLFQAWKVTDTQTEETVARFLASIAEKGGNAHLSRFRANSLVTTCRESKVNEYLSHIARTTRQQAAERSARKQVAVVSKQVAAISESAESETIAAILEDAENDDEDQEQLLEEWAARVGATLGWKCHYCGEENHTLRKCPKCRKAIEEAAAFIKKSWLGASNQEPKAIASFITAIATELNVPLAQNFAKRVSRAPFRERAEGSR